MTPLDVLGHVLSLTIRRLGPPGAFLALDPRDGADAPTVLLSRAEIPEGAEIGDSLKVFVHLDSEDRPIATRRMPRIQARRGRVFSR